MACKYVQKIDSNKNIYLCVDDPIYGKFEVPHPFSKIVLCKEMQRLKNISQTGFAHYQWPGLEEGDRLSHSMGAFYLMGLMIDQIEKGLSKYDIHISKRIRTSHCVQFCYMTSDMAHFHIRLRL